jgi:hypothetical protein
MFAQPASEVGLFIWSCFGLFCCLVVFSVVWLFGWSDGRIVFNIDNDKLIFGYNGHET